ncbi:MAG: family 43 glycosylhydrolase [Limnochordia bacterium]|nr:family 43 glycosylhydrolase [Limnochordia bacterium]
MREDCDNWKRKVVVLFLALLCLIGGGCEGTGAAKEPLLPPDSKPVQLQQGQKVFPYYNPVYPGDGPDPALLRVGEYFYTAVTGQRIMRSKDMIHWETVGTMFAKGYPAWVDSLAPQFIWAPELQFINNQYVLYFSAKERGYMEHRMGIGAAWSDKPEGPYTGVPTPLASGPGYRDIDPAVFRDDDGTLYIYWGSHHEPILVQKLSSDGLSLVGEPSIALNPAPHIRYSRLVEAPWIIKRGDYYYLFWSGDNYIPGEYALSVGRSTSPLGPFERYWGNPILQGDHHWASPGHNALIQDDAGQDWLFYHAYDWTDTTIGRMLLLDQLIWQDGWPHVANRTPSTKPITEGPIWNSTAIPIVEVARGKEAWASSEQEHRSASYALDGSTLTSWLPRQDDHTPWIIIDLGKPFRVGKVDLRFGKRGDHRYQIETSQDGTSWFLFADRLRSGAYPYSEVNEATARYVRIRLANTGEDGALREVRVYAYQNVWLASPANPGPMPSPISIEPVIAPEMAVKEVRVTLDAMALYEGTKAPVSSLNTSWLADGVHHLVLEVIDERDTIWRHAVGITVKNAMILEPLQGCTLWGESIIRLHTGATSSMIRNATVSLVPIVMGEPRTEERVVVYEAPEVLGELNIDTLHLADGSYQLEFAVTTQEGHQFRDTLRVLIRNWETVHDFFDPPKSLGWFGTVDQKKTIEESIGWDYDTTRQESFFGDESRRVWTGQGTGHLVWEIPSLSKYKVTAYIQDVDISGVEISTSLDGLNWTQLESEQRVVADSLDWRKIEFGGSCQGAAKYFRVSLREGLDQDRIQLGHVELVYRSEPQS